MIIQHNITALNAYRQLGNNNNTVSKNLEKLSSGYKINRAGDDAAGLAISEKMRSQIKGLETASKNANDGISLIQTAEGALTEVHSMLNRMVELATQSANGTYTEGDRAKLQGEVQTLRSEIDRIAEGTNFNGINLLDGSLGGYKIDAKTLEANLKNTGSNFSVSGGKLAATDSVAFTFANNKLTALTAGGITNTSAAGSKISFKMTTVDYDGNKVVTTGAFSALGNVTLPTAANVTIELVAGTDATKADFDKFNGVKLNFNKGAADTTLASTAISGTSGLNLQVGDTNEDFQKVNVEVKSMSAKNLEIDDVDISTEQNAGASIKKINSAIEEVSQQRAGLGALQNRLEHTINNLGVTTENMTAAESRIRDTDMAKEMMNYTKNNILTQAAQSMLAQANQLPQGVLQLLR